MSVENLNLLEGRPEQRKYSWIKTHTKSDFTVLDIGACVGEYTKLFANLLGKNGTLVAFEPERENYKVLRDIGRVNCNLIMENTAVSNFVGDTTLFLGPNKGWHSLVEIDRFNKKDCQQSVKVTTVDNYLFKLSISSVDIIKMDVEGADLEVLQGASEIIDNSPSLSIIAEIHKDHGIDTVGLFDFLTDKGFRIYDVKKTSGILIDTADKLSYEIIAMKG